MRSSAWIICGPTILLVASGAGCPQAFLRRSTPAPRLLSAQPSLAEVAQILNANSARVQSVYAPQATADMPGAPALRAQIAFQRPYRFRLVANLIGPVVDVGSNDELFWLWTQQDNSVYYCRHDSFAQSSARTILPVEPTWLAEAFGLVTLEPTDQHTGPIPWGAGQLRVDTVRRGPLGTTRRVAILHADSAWVLEQHIYDSQGQLIASAYSSQHWIDPATGGTIARHTDIRWPTVGMGIVVDLGNVVINDPSTDSPGRWDMPRNGTLVDLADPRSGAGLETAARGLSSVADPYASAPRAATRWRPSRPPR